MRAEFAKARRKAAPRLASFAGGLDELTSALAGHLGADLHLACRVLGIAKLADGFGVTVAERGDTRVLPASAVVLAVPAYVATTLVTPFDDPLGRTLAAIPYVPVALAHLGYAASALSRPVAAYGFFVPPSEPLRVLGGIFPSQFFAGRAPAGCHLFSVRMGGARDAAALGLPDAELAEVADRELRSLLGLTAGPVFVHIVRHARALPQYTLGHMGRVAELGAGEQRHPGLFFHGNAYHNAGVPELVSRSQKLAARIAASLGGA
jgi:oxygen-dependent protoporphyrinogen oxidase